MYVYAIGDNSGTCKIGITNDLSKRLSSLQVGWPKKLFVLASATTQDRQAAILAERCAHEAVEIHRLSGEWFECSSEQASDAIAQGVARAEILRESRNLRIEPDFDFSKWLATEGLTTREAAVALGASPSAVQSWKRKKPPRYIMLACMCIAAALPPWGEASPHSSPSKRR